MEGYKEHEQIISPEPSADADTVSLVNLINEIGPDIAEVARRLGQFKESVRYRYKEKIVKRGFQVKADLDYGALGLTRVVMKLRLAEEYRGNASELFEAMSDLCYVVAYAGTMPQDVYIVHGGVPTELVGQFHNAMESLKEHGIFAAVEFIDCDWFKITTMRAESFDWDAGVWDFDWNDLPPADERAARQGISEKQKVDKIDLLILKELAKDSDRSLMDVQSAIKKINGIDVNYKTLGWHYQHHVLGHSLIRDYSVTWHGLRANFGVGRNERLGRYDNLGLSIIVRGTTEQEKVILRSSLNRIPFQWSEAAGTGYYSQLFVPLGMANEALEYLKKVLSPYGQRAEIFVLDRREMKSFTVAHNLWDEQSAVWTFDAVNLASRLEGFVLKIRERSA